MNTNNNHSTDERQKQQEQQNRKPMHDTTTAHHGTERHDSDQKGAKKYDTHSSERDDCTTK